MKKYTDFLLWLLKMAVGCFLFGLGFDLFLEPNGLNAGGVSGIAMILHHVTNFATVGVISAMINLPLFFLGGKKIGGEFFVGSLIGTVGLSVSFDLFALIPPIRTEPLVAALYGGIICGVGLGIVFLANASTGGSDIVVRLLKSKYRNLNIGQISIGLDFVVAALTAVVFGDVDYPTDTEVGFSFHPAPSVPELSCTMYFMAFHYVSNGARDWCPINVYGLSLGYSF